MEPCCDISLTSVCSFVHKRRDPGYLQAWSAASCWAIVCKSEQRLRVASAYILHYGAADTGVAMTTGSVSQLLRSLYQHRYGGLDAGGR